MKQLYVGKSVTQAIQSQAYFPICTVAETVIILDKCILGESNFAYQTVLIVSVSID